MTRTLMIMAGGTGGHVMPALAVADCLRDKGWKVVWLGTRTGLEAKLVLEQGYAMEWLNIGGLRGKGVLRKLLMPLMLLVAFYQSAAAIFRNRPDVVLGMGGYTAFPGGMMASLLARPLVIHEQNSIGGLTNRILACLADRVLVAFPEVFRSGKDKPLPCGKVTTEWCGNPVRRDIVAMPTPQERFANRSGKLRLLVVGGSLGAQALNETVPRALAMLPEAERPEVVHQAGAKHFDALRGYYAEAEVAADVRAFIDDMAALYAWCDLVICRAGALTVAEIAAVGVASVLVPFPYAVDDHQTTNAQFLSARGAAVLLPQPQMSAERLAQLLREATREQLLKMAQAARALAKPEATQRVAQVCMELAE